jgi:hypothetical protein
VLSSTDMEAGTVGEDGAVRRHPSQIDAIEGTAASTHVFFRIVLLEGKNLVPADNLNSRGEPSSDPCVLRSLYSLLGLPSRA